MNSIATALTSVSSAIDIVRTLAGAKGAVERAELKNKLADLLGDLADAKLALVETEVQLRALDERLRVRESCHRGGEAYFADGDDAPCCARCLEVDDRLIHLIKPAKARPSERRNQLWCPECDQAYDRRRIINPRTNKPVGPDDSEDGRDVRVASF